MMAKKLGLGTEERQLKLGSSFLHPRSNTFHSIRYDFKPASVDIYKKATVDVGNNNQVTVTVPHLDGAGVPQTLFKGSQKPYQKECVLIIDKNTGEITLEKLSSNIQVKKTRTESHKAPAPAPNRPLTPVEHPPAPIAQRTSTKTKVTSGSRRNANPVGLVPKHSPLHASPSHHQSPSHNHNKLAERQSHDPPLGHSTLASLPMIGLDDVSEPTPPLFKPPSPSHHSEDEQNGVGILSDSSSSSSSDSDSSDSDSETEPPPPPPRPQNNGTLRATNGKSPSLSVPDHLLKEDLCLSESATDSD